VRRLAAWPVLPLLLTTLVVTAQSSAQQVYAVDPTASEIHWLVYKAGAFARLGHNHVISVGGLTGQVAVDRANLANSTFELEIPVADLVVDDPEMRRSLGDEFSSVPSADDIAGTRKNMLSDRVLDGERFQALRVTGVGPKGTAGEQTMQIAVQLLGRAVDLTVPTQVTIDGDTLEAAGEFTLTHTDLGMKPFSVMAGALQVGEKLDFFYRVRAHREK
jgi:YceI-like protein